MPQNQFDKWLRDKVNPYKSGETLDQEWSMIQARLEENNKRRPLFFWIWTGAAIAGLIVIANLTFHNGDDKTSAPTMTEQAILPESENEGIEYYQVKDQDIKENQLNQEVKINSEQLAIHAANTQKSEIKNETFASPHIDNTISVLSTQITSETRLNDGINNPTNKSTKSNNRIQLGISSRILQQPIVKDRPLENNTTAILHVSKGIEWTLELERPKSFNNKFRPHTSWHLELVSNVGQGYSDYESENDATKIRAFEEVEKAKEFVSFDIRAYKGLGKGWWLGSGIGLEYMHIVSEQGFIDTVSGALHEQIVKIREDRNGNQMDIIGTTNGRTIYDINRKRHQIHASLSIPVIVKYDYSIDRNWFISGEMGIASTIYNYRAGKSIISNEKDILEMDLTDRYSMGYRGSLLIGIAMNHHLSERISISFGVQGQKDLFGNESVDRTWTQKLSNIGLRAGLRYTL